MNCNELICFVFSDLLYTELDDYPLRILNELLLIYPPHHSLPLSHSDHSVLLNFEADPSRKSLR